MYEKRLSYSPCQVCLETFSGVENDMIITVCKYMLSVIFTDAHDRGIVCLCFVVKSRIVHERRLRCSYSATAAGRKCPQSETSLLYREGSPWG